MQKNNQNLFKIFTFKRAEILESLAKHQVSTEELAQYKSSTNIGAKIIQNKRFLFDII